MDPFDEFEFKPLTEGLGFNKKAGQAGDKPKTAKIPPLKTATQFSLPQPAARSASALGTAVENDLLGREAPRATSKSISDLIASLPPSLDFLEDKPTPAEERPQIFQPLAREEYKPTAGPTIGQVLPPAGMKATTAPTIPAPSQFRGRLDEGLARAFPQPKPSERRPRAALETSGELIPVPAQLGSGVLDGMVVCGMSTVLLVCILLITRVNLVGLLSNAQTDTPTQIHLALLFAAVLQLYMLTARSFFGATLGEWAFDLQLGGSFDQGRVVYPILVAWRTFLLTATGIVFWPLASLVAKQDLLKYLTGLQLYRKP